MIAKKIRNPRKSASKYVRIQRLVDYVRKSKGKEDKEKNVYEGTRNFFAEEKKAQVKEMQDLAHAAARSKDPITHYVISWKSHEKPTPKQIERTVDVVLNELKMKNHQVIYAVHADTKHHHLHLVVNRVHPETERVNNARNDYDSMDRAVARITHEQKWERKQNERFQVNARNKVERIQRPPRQLQPSQEKQDKERRTGVKSAERIAQEKAPAVLRAASSWKELYENLAKEGMGFEKKGSGAVLKVGKVPVKASSVGKEYSLGSLQKRLGAFEPSHQHLYVQSHSPEPLTPKVSDWQRYQREKVRYEENRKDATTGLRARHAHEKRELVNQNQEKQVQLFSKDWKGRGKELNQERSRLAGENKAALAQLKTAQASELQSLKQKYPPFPSLDAWRAKQHQHQPEPEAQQTQHPNQELPKQAAQQQEQAKQQQEQERVAAQQAARRKQPDIER